MEDHRERKIKINFKVWLFRVYGIIVSLYIDCYCHVMNLIFYTLTLSLLLGLNTLPLSRTQSQILTNSSILETHPNQFFRPAITTCNEKVVSHCQNNRVMENSTPNGGESLENSIPNEVSTLHKETQHDESHMNLSSIDLDMEYWSNFLLEDMKWCFFVIIHQLQLIL